MNEENSQQKKPGLLCEDTTVLETTDKDGQEHLVRTPNREATEKTMRESENGLRPTHDRIEG